MDANVSSRTTPHSLSTNQSREQPGSKPRPVPCSDTHTSPPKLSYSINEACQATSLGRTTIYGHIAAGRLPVIRVGGRTLIPADALRAFVSC